MKTIIELESLLSNVESSPRTYFGDEIDARLRLLLKDCHPDHFKSDADKESADRLFKRFSTLADECRAPKTTIKTKTRQYTLESRIAIGDVSDVHLASANTEQYLLKMSRIAGADKLLAHEHFVLSELAEKSGDSTYKFYFPTPIETIKAQDGMRKQVNVFAYDPGGYTAEQIHAKHPALKGEHLAWIYKRILTGLGFAHTHKWIHNAVLPCHLIIYPGTHGVQLIDWKLASTPAVLKSISAKYRDWYPPEVSKKQPTDPSTDIYMATKCLIYLAGGNPLTKEMPASVPVPMQAFFRSALLEAQRMRPQSAWDLLNEFTDMLKPLYGTPQFHTLSMV